MKIKNQKWKHVSILKLLTIRKKTDKRIMSVSNNPKESISLRDRFQKYHGENMAKEFSWDEDYKVDLWND